MKKIITIILCLFSFAAFSQYTDKDVEEYVTQYQQLAKDLMKEYKIPASIKLAQAIYASDAGKSTFAKATNNHFKILCHAGYSGKTYYETSDKSGDCFRMYQTVKEAYIDHSLFITQRKRYSELFELPITDYQGWARKLQEAGYSINEKYGETLIALIEKYQLFRYDKDDVRAIRDADGKTLKPDTIINGISIYINRNKDNRNETGKLISKNATSQNIGLNVFTAKESEYKNSYFPYVKRNVYENNKIKFVIAKKGDTYAKIADEAQLLESDLRNYNDAYEAYEPTDGEVVYLQIKNTKSPVEFHELGEGDSFRYLSQKYAIQLKIIMKRNKATETGFAEKDLICIDCK